jgi:GNAT superfamily N-acetyltransferase
MDEPVIRPVHPGDGQDLARGWIDTGSYYAELDPDAFQIPAADGLAQWFEGLLQQPRSQQTLWLVAEVDGRVVGNVEAHLERPIDSAARQLLRDVGQTRVVVDALSVETAYRRQGVGSRLMHAVEAWARANDAVLISLDTYIGSALSLPFYEHLGYQKRSVIFQKRLD